MSLNTPNSSAYLTRTRDSHCRQAVLRGRGLENWGGGKEIGWMNRNLPGLVVRSGDIPEDWIGSWGGTPSMGVERSCLLSPKRWVKTLLRNRGKETQDKKVSGCPSSCKLGRSQALWGLDNGLHTLIPGYRELNLPWRLSSHASQQLFHWAPHMLHMWGTHMD